MKKWIPFLAVFAALLSLVSCEKDGLTYLERKIVGTWEFDRVTENGRNITNEYKQQEVTFNADFSAKYVDDQAGIIYTGVWDLVRNNANETTTNSVFASFTNPATNEVMQLVLGNAGINRNRITGNFRDGFTNYRYRLERK